ncbi:MAG: hypothetical protein AABY10_05475 [Nanoarchaeota archaeon]
MGLSSNPKNKLNKEDKSEMRHLRTRLSKLKKGLSGNDYNVRKSLLDAIVSGEAQRTGVDTIKALEAKGLSLLQRERGQRDGQPLYFGRCFRHHGQLYSLDSLFNLPQISKQYAYLE